MFFFSVTFNNFMCRLFRGDISEAGINEILNFLLNKDILNMVSISLFITLNRQDCNTVKTEANMKKQTNGSFTYYVITEGGRGRSGKCLCLIMGEGGGGKVILWHKQIEKVIKKKSHFVCSISLLVLYNNKVNHTLCNALLYKFFTFFVQICI